MAKTVSVNRGQVNQVSYLTYTPGLYGEDGCRHETAHGKAC